MLHNMKLQRSPFERILNGSKTIELRLYDEKRRQVRAGDEILFSRIDDSSQTILTEVTAIHLFESFDELYRKLPLEKCGYLQEEINTASAADMNEYYTIEEQQKYGVVGIEIAVSAK